MCYSIEAPPSLFRKLKMFLLYPVHHSATAEQESLGQSTVTPHHPSRDDVPAQLHHRQRVIKVR